MLCLYHPVYADTIDVENVDVGFDIYCMNAEDAVFIYWNGIPDCKSVSVYEKAVEWNLVSTVQDETCSVIAPVGEPNVPVKYVAVAQLEDGREIRSQVATNVFVKSVDRYFPYALDEGIVLEWPAVIGANEYFIYKYDVNDLTYGKPMLIGSTDTTKYVDTESKTPNVRYWYAVRAVIKYNNRCYLSDFEPTMAFYDPLRPETTEESAMEPMAEPEPKSMAVPEKPSTSGTYEPEVMVDSASSGTVENAVTWMINAFEDPDAQKVLGEKGWSGKNYSCSSLITRGYIAAGVPILDATNGKHIYTDGIPNVYTKCGFTEVTDSVNLKTGEGLKRGDVLINKKVSHTGMFLGNYNGKENMLLDARQSHWVTAYNGKNYNWARVFRYTGS